MKYSRMKRSNPPNSGSVLFIVLIFIISVTTLVLVSTTAISSEADFLQNETDRLRAYTRCISGMEYLKNRLCTSMRENLEYCESPGEPLYPRLLLDGSDLYFHFADIIRKYPRGVPRIDPDDDTAAFVINLQDSAGLINFFTTHRNLLHNLFAHHKFPPALADTAIDSLLDWLDDDDFLRPRGAESQYYFDQFGYTAANRHIQSPDQLQLVQGFDRDVYNTIGHLLDFTIENRGVNPNTMPPEAFYIFKGITPANIERILRERHKGAFTDPDVLTQVSGYNFSANPDTLQLFTSDTTYVKIKAVMNNQRHFYIAFRLDLISGLGAMRDSSRDTGIMNKRNPGVHFGNYYSIRDWQEGTEPAEPQEY